MRASACSSVNISVCMEETTVLTVKLSVITKLSYKHCTEIYRAYFDETDENLKISMLNRRLVMYTTVFCLRRWFQSRLNVLGGPGPARLMGPLSSLCPTWRGGGHSTLYQRIRQYTLRSQSGSNIMSIYDLRNGA